ncbi:acyltransferase [Kribbella albertanoniae]|uniref:Acyltransferase n=1 Tax=Kribbella albertanoniae TaxID=1266829 RepID=A0A4R4PJ46_9ACTN|nr:acyltransferase [Kribbella albertanoniae]TDC22032.1 acyltransferase [Kribbella albertanoniae]
MTSTPIADVASRELADTTVRTGTSRQPMSHAEYLGLKRFPALDGLRAIAALMVVVFHNQGPDWLQGWIGVQIFFVISGFLITTLMLREEDRSGQISFKKFYARRIFRILPVYFVLLGVTLFLQFLHGTLPKGPPGTELPLYLFFFNEFGNGGQYGQSWSLGIEQKFYLFWPLLAFSAILVQRRRKFRGRVGLTLVLMAIMLAMVPLSMGGDPRGWTAHYFSILVGCLVAILMHNRRTYAIFKPLTRPWVACTAAAAFVAIHGTVHLWGAFIEKHHLAGDVPGFIAVPPPYVVLVGFLLLPALLANAFPQRLLSARPFVFLGERSYSIYLVQLIAHEAVVAIYLLFGANLGKTPVPFVAVSLMSILMAHLCYRWVEQPMITVGKRFISTKLA